LLSFADRADVPRHHVMSGVDVILPVRGAKNERAFAALIYAMMNNYKVLIARMIEKKNSEPKLVVLFPDIGSNKQPLLYLAEVPTTEDLRDFQFPPLVESTNDQRKAAAKLIDKLSLVREEDGEVVEYLQPEQTFNPTIQYFN